MPDRDSGSILEQVSNDFISPYRPSIFICCILILSTTFAIILEVIIPAHDFVFTLTTYGPTIHFAVRSIIQTVRGSHTESGHVKSNAKYSVILAVVWVLTIACHYWLWWMERSGYAGIFLNGVFPGSQSTLIMLYIALRYVLHRRARERTGTIRLPDEEEASSPHEAGESTLNAPEPSSEENGSENAQCIETTCDYYRPSILLLLLSVILTIFAAITDILTNNLWFEVIAAVQAYIPTFLTQLYIFGCVVRRKPQDSQALGASAGFTFELTLCWIWTRVLIITTYALPTYGPWFIPGVVETVLMLYFCVRYALSLSKTSMVEYKRIQSRILLIGDETITGEESSISSPAAAVASVHADAYRPSIFFLILGIVLSVACICIEVPREPAIGAPMSALVYAPTILIYATFIFHWWRHTVTDLKTYESATERSIQLAAIWVLTHAFYLFVWPVSQYLNPKVMNPYVRGSAVGVSLYIATSFILEKFRTTRDGQITSPPDHPDSSTSPAVPIATLGS